MSSKIWYYWNLWFWGSPILRYLSISIHIWDSNDTEELVPNHHLSPWPVGSLVIQALRGTFTSLQRTIWQLYIFWLVVWTPLKNISQLGWLFSIYILYIYIWKNKKCSKPPTSIYIYMFTKHVWTLKYLRGIQDRLVKKSAIKIAEVLWSDSLNYTLTA